jgi:hypothetical protein
MATMLNTTGLGAETFASATQDLPDEPARATSRSAT